MITAPGGPPLAGESAEILRVRLLGPVAAWRGDQQLDLGPGRQRAVFAVLAAQAGQVVPRDVLISEVWGEGQPPAASKSLYSYVSRLRRACTRQVLVSAGDGYSLRLAPGALDVGEFDRLRQVAHDCWNRRDIAGARTALDAALALWRGEALEGVDGPFAESYRKRLAELRLATLERRAEVMIASAEPGAVDELRHLTRSYPLRETLTGLLMTALRRAGRADEAIKVFDEARKRLVEQLGIEPGAVLRKIHKELTAADRPNERARTRQLRGEPDILVGRSAELATLRSRLAGLRRGRGGAVWIEGGPGTGKSALLAAALGRPDLTHQLLWAEGDETRRSVPLQLMRACLGIDRRSTDPRRAGLAEALATPPPEQSPWQPESMAVDRLAGFVDQLTAAGPVVLVLDDLQWADDASLLVWHRLAKTARHTPLLLVGAARPLPRRPEIDRLRSAVAAGGDLLRLGPLAEPEVDELVSRLLGARPGEVLLAAVDCAAGNPHFLREVIDALLRDDLVRVVDGVAELAAFEDLDGPALRTVLIRRCAALTEPTRQALRWAAILGAEFDLADLARVLGRSASELVPAVEEAIAAGVLREAGDWFTFRHPLLRQALYTAMSRPVRTALHRQAARLLADSGAAVARVAGQLLVAPVGVDAWVANWLVDNVNTIAGRSPAIAVELLTRALRDPALRAPAREVLAARHARLGFWLGRQPVEALTQDPPAVGNYWAGRWDAVLAELDSLVHDGPQAMCDRGAIRMLHGISALIAVHRDDPAGLELAFKALPSEDDFTLMAKAVACEQRGEPENALALLTSADIREQWLPTVVRLALGLGDTAAAQVAPGQPDIARWCRALVDGDAETLSLVAENYGRLGRKIGHAMAAEDAAVQFARDGRIEDAQRVCQAAMTGYAELGAAWDAGRLELRLRPFGIRPRNRPGIDRSPLSAIESTVAELVASGWPDTEIASQLVLSRDAVQTHVARVLAKLGVASRLGVTLTALDKAQRANA